MRDSVDPIDMSKFKDTETVDRGLPVHQMFLILCYRNYSTLDQYTKSRQSAIKKIIFINSQQCVTNIILD